MLTVLLALGMINAEKRHQNSDDNLENGNGDKEGIYERIGRACEGVAITIIPVILHMSSKQFLSDE